jgi:hypothetical protein
VARLRFARGTSFEPRRQPSITDSRNRSTTSHPTARRPRPAAPAVATSTSTRNGNASVAKRIYVHSLVTTLSQDLQDNRRCGDTHRHRRCRSATPWRRSDLCGNRVPRTVNPSAYAYSGSNPLPATQLRACFRPHGPAAESAPPADRPQQRRTASATASRSSGNTCAPWQPLPTRRGSPTTLTGGVATVTRAERTSSLV